MVSRVGLAAVVLHGLFADRYGIAMRVIDVSSPGSARFRDLLDDRGCPTTSLLTLSESLGLFMCTFRSYPQLATGRKKVERR